MALVGPADMVVAKLLVVAELLVVASSRWWRWSCARQRCPARSAAATVHEQPELLGEGEIDAELERHEIELGRVDRERLQAILRVIAAEARRTGSDGREWRVELSRVLESREEAEPDTDAQVRLAASARGVRA